MKDHKVSVRNTKASVRNSVKKIDAFGLPLPTFRLKGQEAVYSLAGGVCTLFISITVFTYALVKFQ